MTDERAAAVARRMALMARMKSIAKEAWGNDPIRRVHLVVAIDRLLVRLLETTSWGVWVLKGGYANQLRHPSEARFTEDVDVRIDADISGATPMVTDALTLHIEDPFEFELASRPRELVGPPGGGMRYPVIARLVGQELVRFKIDVSSRDAIVGDLERYPSDPIIKMLDLVPALFPVYPVAQQFAEKLHAYTLPRDVENTRAKDLADMLWLMSRHTLASGELIDACTATFERRDEHDWPPTLPQPPRAWARPYAVLRDEMDIAAATIDDAYAKLSTFLAPVLRGDRGLRWEPDGGWVTTAEAD